jgi:hypothetical protein
MPALDIIIRTAFTSEVSTQNLSPIIRYLVSGLTLLVLGIVMIYVERVFNICVPNSLIPWCTPISHILFLNILIKAILVASVATDFKGKYAIYEVGILFGL